MKIAEKRTAFHPKAAVTFVLASLCFYLSAAGGYGKDEESVLFWPAPPAELRIIFVKTIYSPKDLGIRPGLLRKLKRFITGERQEILNRPIAVAVDRARTIYIGDPGGGAVHIFNQKEKQYKRLTAIRREGLVSPVGVAASENGLIFISDSKLGKVFCVDENGRFKFVIADGKLIQRPAGLAVFKEKLYVADAAAHRIAIFDLKGRFLAQFGRRGKNAGEFNYPTAITADREGNIYVVDTLNFRIQVFDCENRFLYSIGQAGDSSGSFSRPKGVALDSFGHIYSTDGLFDNVQVFNQNREFLLSWGESGQKDGEFWIASGIAIDEQNYIYVADSYNQRIQVFRYVGKD